MSVTPIDIAIVTGLDIASVKTNGRNVVREHIERITDEHERMATLLRDLHAVMYGARAAAIRVAHEYGLDPFDRSDWMTTLRTMLGTDIDQLLTEVHTPAQASKASGC